jgi:K+-transporting ATPase KdpF subunit
MKAFFLIATTKHAPEIIGSDGYAIGVLIAVLVLVFLIYTLLKPEKF